MYGTLLIEVFNKLKEEHPEYSDTRSGEELSNIIEEITTKNGARDTYTGRTLRDKREEALGGDEVTFRLPIANALSNYLGYGNYSDYVTLKTKKAQTLKDRAQGFYSKHRAKSVGVLALLVILISWIGLEEKEQHWMAWKQDHYEEVPFNGEMFKIGELKMFNAKTIENLKRVDPNCQTIFFTGTDKPLIWYGKATNKEYEFFSARGDHPVTGKPLKPITRYMIKKYICP
ncbi:hypothetical protein SAMN05216480_10673 [Pustulibacterium marinum]|uniref:Uncharacterized protein n=1 Tax=Pustulibacterium marinum TaxID=1224947 RepID=A0A1I7GXJ8_9FLAO|nr:hypothetical protein [Pustulibacterium marinum]SFU53167.1 hypothetical protein SAMN05216480_10673 [Pustulibacterium marinum]